MRLAPGLFLELKKMQDLVALMIKLVISSQPVVYVIKASQSCIDFYALQFEAVKRNCG